MYEKELSVAINAVRLAGKKIMSYFNQQSNSVETKKDNTMVTKADVESNKIIVEEIRRNFPLDGIISEELSEIEGNRKWYVDPLDGTESFVRKSDEFGIHIGLCESGVPVLGVVYRVAKGDIYYSIKNQGAFREGKDGKFPLIISADSPLEAAVTSYGEKELGKIADLLKALEVKKIVRAASTGLRILKLADGEADIYVVSSPLVKPWDICAPQAILQESGGKICYKDGSEVLYQPGMNGEKTIFFARTSRQLSLLVDKAKHIPINN